MPSPERAERMKPILDRIPPPWGKYLDYPREWDEDILALDRRLAEVDPGYTVHQVKEKFGLLRFYFHSDGPNPALMEELVQIAEYVIEMKAREQWLM